MRHVQILFLLSMSFQLVTAQTQWRIISNNEDELVLWISNVLNEEAPWGETVYLLPENKDEQ